MLRWKSGTEMVEQWNNNGAKVEQRWWNSGISDGGTVEHVTVEKWNRDGGTVEQRWWNSGPAEGGTVEQS